MAIRNIVKHGDDILAKKCRVVEQIDNRILTLLDDMVDTMREADGVGLAAPQVTYIMNELKGEGLDVPIDVTTVEEACDELIKLLQK